MLKRKYIFWKVIFIICSVLLAAYGAFEVFVLISDVLDDYPRPFWGVDIMNWYDAFLADTVIYLFFLGIPLIIVVVFLIISRKKLRKYKNEKADEVTKL